MPVSDGMDVARVREVAVQLHREAHRLADVSTQGSAQMTVLEEAWEGVDSQGFGQQWMTTDRTLFDCSGRLSAFADTLTRQAGQQDETSDGTGGRGAGIPGVRGGPSDDASGGPSDDASGGQPRRKPDPKAEEDTPPNEHFEGPLFDESQEEQADDERGPIEPTDVEQGSLADCWFITSLQAVASSNPGVIEDNVEDNGDGTYTVTLYEDGEPVEYVVTPDFPATNGDPHHADNPGDRELWPLLYEKAMAQHMGGSWDDMNYDTAERALEAITGADADTEGTGSGFLWLDPPPDSDAIRGIVEGGGQVALSSHDDVDGRPAYEGADGIVTNHIYWVKEVKDDGTLVIINPYDASETAHEMSYDEYRENFSHITTAKP